MGWASYNEDIVSRWVGGKHMQDRLSGVVDPPNNGAKAAGPSRISSVEAHVDPVSRKSGMSKLKEFTATTARPLPVVILADTSGSMSENGKIEALNTALMDMIGAFGEEEQGRAEIHVAVITFGGTAQIHQELVAAAKIALRPLSRSS